MCFSTVPVPVANPQPAASCPAKLLTPDQRQDIAWQALNGQTTISELAQTFHVSRKFIYQQCSIAELAVDQAFQPPPPPDDTVLFSVNFTKSMIEQLVLSLTFMCHSSYRGTIELLRDVFDYSISIGNVSNIIHSAIPVAQKIESQQSLEHIRIGAHDEIFQNNCPVFVGADTRSTYCYLLSLEEHRDGDTWALRNLELQDRGFAPKAIVADAGKGLRAGAAEGLPGVPCRSDVFHALQEVGRVATYLENQAYRAMKAAEAVRRKLARAASKGEPTPQPLLNELDRAQKKETQAIDLADHVAIIAQWLRCDILAADGPAHAGRLALYDFIIAELLARVGQAPKHLGKLITYLKGQKADVLAFARELDEAFAKLAEPLDLDPELIRELFAINEIPEADARHWPRRAALQRILGGEYHWLSEELKELRRNTVRASSLAENLNSRLRGYFFLRRQLGNKYLSLLQFFLNHRRFMRSEHPDREGKSPAEIMTGQQHPHWLEMLGYTRFSRN